MTSFNPASSFLHSLAQRYPLELHAEQPREAYAPQGSGYMPQVVVRPGWFSSWGSGTQQPLTSRHIVATTPETIQQLHQTEMQDQERSRASSFAWIGGLATVALAGVAGFFGRSMHDNHQAITEARNFQTNVLPSLDPSRQAELSTIVQRELEIREASYAKTRNWAILGGITLGAAIAAFTGGMLVISWLMTASIIVGVAAAAFGVFSVAWHWNDQTELPAPMQNRVHQLVSELG